MMHGWRGVIACSVLCSVVTGCSGDSTVRSNGSNDAGSPSAGGSEATSGGSGAATGGGAANGGAATGGTATGGTATGGTATGGTATGGAAGRGCGGEYSILVTIDNAVNPTHYRDAVATIRDVDGRRELEVVGEKRDEGGLIGYIRLVVAPFVSVGNYTCSGGASRITTLQEPGEDEYDTRSAPMNECTIVIAGAGLFSSDSQASGTFEGIPHDPIGGSVMLEDGSFCARLAH